MIQEDKELLLKDLCSRLPYGVICEIYNATCTIKEKLLFGGISHFADDTICVRPFLRQMSSMTDDERKELYGLLLNIERLSFADIIMLGKDTISPAYDWLNAHHFDYRGLIEKGLALEAPKDMYGKEEEK